MTWSARRKGKRRGWSGEKNGEEKPASFRATNGAVSFETIKLSPRADHAQWFTDYSGLYIRRPNDSTGINNISFFIKLEQDTGIWFHEDGEAGEMWTDILANGSVTLRSHFSGSVALRLPTLDPETTSDLNFIPDTDNVIFWLDKTTHKLLITVKYDDDTIKTAEIALT